MRKATLTQAEVAALLEAAETARKGWSTWKLDLSSLNSAANKLRRSDIITIEPEDA